MQVHNLLSHPVEILLLVGAVVLFQNLTDVSIFVKSVGEGWDF